LILTPPVVLFPAGFPLPFSVQPLMLHILF
jgi:hypothetical protein